MVTTRLVGGTRWLAFGGALSYMGAMGLKARVVGRVCLVSVLGLSTSACGVVEWITSMFDDRPSFEVEVPTAVASSELAALLPEIDGFERTTLHHESHTHGDHTLSQAHAIYTAHSGGNTADSGGKTSGSEGTASTMRLDILDGTHVPAVHGRLAVVMHGVDDVHRKPISVQGHSGIQHWNPQAGTVQVTLIVDRFVVELNGSAVSPAVVASVLEALDLKQLAARAGKSKGGASKSGH